MATAREHMLWHKWGEEKSPLSLGDRSCNEEGKETSVPSYEELSCESLCHSQFLWSLYPAEQKWLCHTSDISNEINVSISTVCRLIASWAPQHTNVMHH